MNIELYQGRSNSMGTWYYSDLYDIEGYWVQSTSETCYSGYTEDEVKDLELKRHAAKRIEDLEEQIKDWERVLNDD